jgi:hypothetical protein
VPKAARTSDMVLRISLTAPSLALSRQTLLDHGGDIWADDAPGRGQGGALFWLRLPKNRSAITQEAALLNGAR